MFNQLANTMNTLAIIDFNRTIFDPVLGELLPYAKEMLLTLKKNGVLLSLVSRIEPGRSDILERFGLTALFDSTHFVESKSPELFLQIMTAHRAAPEHTYVIGDYLHEEIRSGNSVGARTIWLHRGAFANLRQESPLDVPWREVKDLQEIIALIEK